jgi:ABC-type multidrug transport system fused ATPase/permease subunit
MLIKFLSLPTYLMCLITIVISVGLSVGVLIIRRRRIHWESFKDNHEVGGFLFNALGLIYAVLVAFVVYATWSDYEASGSVCDREADIIQNLYLDCAGLPPESQAEIKKDILEYLEMIVKDDWPLLAQGKGNPVSREKLIEIWKNFNNINDLGNEKQKIYFGEALNKLNDITELRRLRILSAQSHIPVIIWTVILIGALTSVGFSLFFGTRSFIIQAAMTSLFAMTNAIVILMIIALDHPFTGDIKISSEAYEQVLLYLKSSF